MIYIIMPILLVKITKIIPKVISIIMNKDNTE